MGTKLEYTYEYPSGTTFILEIDGSIIQLFHFDKDNKLIKKTQLTTIRDLIGLLPKEG
jgi:hypothetical protein